MNNQVVFAAAGHGKTYSLCAQAKEAIKHSSKYVLLISYTNEGVRSLENEFRKQNCGVLDDRVVIKSWYSFLLSEFIKPYQCSLKLKYKVSKKKERSVCFPENYIKSIAFYDETKPPRWYSATHVQYYINKHRDLVPDRTSHLACLCNEHSDGKAIHRMEEIYSHIFIDESQDYAAWDLDIINLLFESQIFITCVGDYKQHTYSTNNGQKYSQYKGEKIQDYFHSLESQGLCEVINKNTTRRFNQEICDYINTIYNDKKTMVTPSPEMQSEPLAENSGVYIMGYDTLAEYCEHYHPVVLRHNKRSKIGFQYNCDVVNYGASKGATYERAVIIPVDKAAAFIEKQIKIPNEQTRAKFYVACTRARHSIVFAIENPSENSLFKPTKIHFAGKTLPAYKFHKPNQSS